VCVHTDVHVFFSSSTFFTRAGNLAPVAPAAREVVKRLGAVHFQGVDFLLQGLLQASTSQRPPADRKSQREALSWLDEQNLFCEPHGRQSTNKQSRSGRVRESSRKFEKAREGRGSWMTKVGTCTNKYKKQVQQQSSSLLHKSRKPSPRRASSQGGS